MRYGHGPAHEHPHRGHPDQGQPHHGHLHHGPFAGWFGPGGFGPGGFGPRGFGPRGFGPKGGFGPPPWAGGGRARRGDVRAAILALLAERPMHGYEMIQELASRTDGAWQPSPGSVYPTLQLLEDEGLVSAAEVDGKRTFTITDVGRAAIAERGDRRPPWEEVSDGIDPGVFSLAGEMRQLMGAVFQVGQAGTSEQRGQAERVLAEARRRLYALLADEG